MNIWQRANESCLMPGKTTTTTTKKFYDTKLVPVNIDKWQYNHVWLPDFNVSYWHCVKDLKQGLKQHTRQPAESPSEDLCNGDTLYSFATEGHTERAGVHCSGLERVGTAAKS